MLMLTWQGQSFAAAERKAVESKAEKAIKAEAEQKEQDQLLHREIMGFVKENQGREPGEGWLYLAAHYRELRQPERSLLYLRTLLRSEHINPRIVWEAMLLNADILNEQKEYASATRELDRLIEMMPARSYLVRAKIARAKIIGRNLTSSEELYKAFRRYFWPWPEKPDIEAIEYIMGFERGYDLEIAMQALVAWEEIASFPEEDASSLANLRIALLYAFDLNLPDRALPFIGKISENTAVAAEAAFIKGILDHFYQPGADLKICLDNYALFRKNTDSLDGYRVAGILQGLLLYEGHKDYETAINTLSTLLETPPHLVASESVSVVRRREKRDEEIDWAMLACRIAGYIAEFKLGNADRARYFYQKISELNKERSERVEDPWTEAALKRTEPGVTEAQVLFDMAYEKYRSRKMQEALLLYEDFINKYPEHELFREALFRTAVIVDDDLRQFDRALEMYERFLIRFAPIKSSWDLDVLYDWGRIDEVRYRIGNLQYLHLKKPVAALDIFSQLAETYPDSYWAMQGLKDSVKIYEEDLGDPDKANSLREEFIARYPDSKDASDYRLTLYKVFLSKNEQIRALHMLREYLDHSLPSEKKYFSLKQEWRDLAYRIREESLRKILKTAGLRDRIEIYQNMMDVMCLASSSQPLETLVEEIKSSDMNDETRWSLVYDAATRMYQSFPDKSPDLFVELVDNATGSAQVSSMLTLGNIAYRVTKDVETAVSWYEKAEKLLPLTDPLIETPSYRLGRLYLVQGHGLKGLDKLRLFTTRFPRSRHLANAYKTMGDACVALNNPERALRYYRRVLRVAPRMAEEVNKLIEEAEKLPTSQEWLKARADQLREDLVATEEGEENEEETGKPVLAEARKVKNADKLTEKDLAQYNEATVYGLFLDEAARAKPAADRMVMFLKEVLRRDKTPADLRNRALRQYISTRFFRFRKPEEFVEEAQQMLIKSNYAGWQSELLFRLAQAQEHFLKVPVDANKSYFEYLSFYPAGRRVEEIRRRIPQVYVKADDKKNALRFFEKLIEDNQLSDEIRVDASMQMARLLIGEDKKEDAIKTLEAALAYKSDSRPEICLRLEKLTEDFSYVRRALESEGAEEARFKALTRLLERAEEEEDYKGAAAILRDFSEGFKLPESKLWIEKKTEELGKRGVIGEIEDLIDQYPEEPETASRMFRLAKMIEGAENTRYRSEDLFYEITLVYPNSEYYRESKIRAENTRAIRAVAELSDMLKTGVKGRESEEVIIERARLLKESLKDLNAAIENYESFIELFPDSPRLDEVYLSLGELALAEAKDPQKAYEYWEKGVAVSRDPFMREDLTSRINRLKLFSEKVLFSEKKQDNESGMSQVFRAWRVNKDRFYALGLLETAVSKLENRPDVARMRYYIARIHEDAGNFDRAAAEYEKALRSLYHPGCRKDMVLFRLARMYARQNREKEALKWYQSLVNRYPRSRLSRSGYYWLHKYEERNNNLTRAHHYLDVLLQFRSLSPVHREVIEKKLYEIEAKMNVEELERLKKLSPSGGGDMPYYIGKVLENNLRDYDRAITQYEEFLKTNPPVRRSREILKKVADLYEKKGDYVKAVSYLDLLLDTYEPSLNNFDLIVRIGSLVEDKLNNIELTELFYTSILAEYQKIRNVREFATAKLKRIEEQKREKARPPRGRKIVKRVYSEDDEIVIEEMEEIIARQVDDLQDFRMAERELEDLWNDNIDSLATLDIMKTLVELNMKSLQDPQKAAMYYQRWLDENPNDPLLKEYTMKLYDHYMEVLRDGQKALRLLEDYIRDHPISIETMDIELKLAKANELLIRNFDEARRIYQRIIDTRQNDPSVHEAYFRIGFVLREGFAAYDEAIKYWQDLIDQFYNNEFADKAQFAIAYTYETYRRDYTRARQNYERILNQYPNSSLQQQARDALLRIEGK
ncbi:MAG: tetratricopeptide repeat protein [Candidatus Riflebacteria bacterium]|nr:tetratricopeptide repeat protein [Candidatus Riflebacteria bacterium]